MDKAQWKESENIRKFSTCWKPTTGKFGTIEIPVSYYIVKKCIALHFRKHFRVYEIEEKWLINHNYKDFLNCFDTPTPLPPTPPKKTKKKSQTNKTHTHTPPKKKNPTQIVI